MKHPRRDELALVGSGNEAGAFPPLARYRLINPFAPGRSTPLTVQAMIHTTLIEVKHGPPLELFEFALEKPALHLVALAIFDEFFLA